MTGRRWLIVLAWLLLLGQLGQAGRAPQAGAQGANGQQGASGQQDAAPPQGGTPPAEQGQPGAQQPTFRTGINFVRVDVIVTDRRAQPIVDLSQNDFQVFEDGKPQTIEQFRLIRVDGNPRPDDPAARTLRTRTDEELELSREDVRVFVLFFDDYHVRRENAISVRDTLTRFVQEHLRPNDVVGVMYPLTPLDALGFTRNHDTTISAIRNFEGRKYDYRARNIIEQQYERQPTEVIERIRNQVVMTALSGLATRLGSLREGRKSIIYVSEGLTTSLPTQLRSSDGTLPPALTNPASRNPLAGNTAQDDRAAFFSQTDLYQRLREVFAAANRNNTSIYSVDPRGLAASEFNIDENVGMNQDRRALQDTQNTLRSLAEETDGRAIVNRNDIVSGMAQIVRDSSFYYLIGYNSTQAPTDGRFHEIDVRVRRPGVEVRSRRGYWAVTAEDLARAATPAPEISRPVQQALASIAPAVQAGKYLRTWMGTERGENGRTRVTLIWEPLIQQDNVRRDPPGHVAIIAADRQGELLYRGRSEDVAGTATAGRGQAPIAVPQRVVFDVPPGEVELRLTVQGASGTGVLDSEIRTVTVPDFTVPDAAISTPRVYRARTARDLQALNAAAAPVPVASREFSRAERLVIRFDVYGNGTATAVLLNRAGGRMSDVPVAVASGGTNQIDLGLSSIASGEYLVEITVKGAANETKELVAFRVGS